MSSKTKKNWFKLTFQYGILLLLGYMGVRLLASRTYSPDFEAYCPFGGLQALGSYLTRDSLSCAMTSMQITMGSVLLVGVVFFSRLFCGYICPLGSLSELIGKAGKKMKMRFNMPRFADHSLRILKYGLLFITFFFTVRSSELFCKKFDPYYAAASGFNSDVVLTWALISIGIFLAGSFFLRLFWCKYLCPLGALSNIFKYTWWFSGTIALYIVMLITGLNISWIYLLAVLCAEGFLLEVFMMRKVKLSLVHISRETSSCTNCRLCSVKCPQGIDVAAMDRVTHVDCTLCGDCLYACPEKDTLKINRRNMRWLPGSVLSILIVLGLIMGFSYELPTIDLKWGSEKQVSDAGTFTMSGLKNVKCFGSSTVFANQMKKIKGVYGVSTYVSSHTVKILYDKTLLNDTTLQKLIFVPEKRIVETVGKEIDSIGFYTMTIDQFFDPLDATYLQYLLQQKTGAAGYQSEFACPVIVRIYFPANRLPDSESLTQVIETKDLTYSVNNLDFNVKLKYKVVTMSDKPEFISKKDYAIAMYSPFSMRFNKFPQYTGDVVSVYQVAMDDNILQRSRYSYIGSHLSNVKGIIGFETALDTTGKEMGNVFFVDSLSSGDKVFSSLNADSLLLHYSNGTSAKILNPFSFKSEGIVKKDN